MIKVVRSVLPNVWIFVDNAYGEFSETKEPLEVGADVMAGSLFKTQAVAWPKLAVILSVKRI